MLSNQLCCRASVALNLDSVSISKSLSSKSRACIGTCCHNSEGLSYSPFYMALTSSFSLFINYIYTYLCGRLCFYLLFLGERYLIEYSIVKDCADSPYVYFLSVAVPQMYLWRSECLCTRVSEHEYPTDAW